MMTKILIVDDDRVSRDLLSEVLMKVGYEVYVAASGEEAIEMLKRNSYPLILSDIRMLDVSGIDLLREAKKINSHVVFVLMTGFGSMEGAIESLREGAFDYISKPFQMEDLKTLLLRASKHAETLVHTQSGQTSTPTFQTQTLIGKSPKIVEVYKTLARAALSKSNVFISGESGTGKALVARAIHDHSPRKNLPFIKANCEGELADFEKILNEVHGGTILLEEVDQLSAAQQIKLMRALESEELGTKDIRIISVSRTPHSVLLKSPGFRSDLFFILNVISLELPPLRERAEDIPELVGVFLAKHSYKNGKQISHLSDSAMQLLRSAEWKGNVRELEHTIEKAVAISGVSVLEPEDFPALLGRAVSPESPSTSLEEMERHHIEKILQETNFNKSKASEVLGIDRATLYRKAKLYGIDLKGGRP